MALIQVKSSQSEQEEEEECMGKYPAVAEAFSEEELPYGFINNVREKRAYKEDPYVYIAA